MLAVNEMKPGLTIHQVAARTGVTEHTLRAWERRYGVPEPGRVPGNRYRVYGEQDIADVLWMKQQIQSGVAPAQAGHMLAQRRREQAPAFEPSPEPLAAAQAALQAALLQSDQPGATRALDQAFALFAPEQVALRVIAPTLHELGERWMRNEITVWQEHLASSLVRQKLMGVLQAMATPAEPTPTLLAACAPGEEHELGLVIFALLVRRQGWHVHYLGQATPLDDLADMARRSPARALAVSVSTVVGLAGLVPWLSAANRPPRALIFGGRLPDEIAALREHLPGDYIGVDALAAARALATVAPRSQYWAPSKRAWNAARQLQIERLRIAGETIAQSGPRIPEHWRAELGRATLFLVDALLSALAFDAPEIMDAQRLWLEQAMPPRHVAPPLIARHLAVFRRVLGDVLSTESAGPFQPLLERMEQ